jgi:cytochrome c peroxidase
MNRYFNILAISLGLLINWNPESEAGNAQEKKPREREPATETTQDIWQQAASLRLPPQPPAPTGRNLQLARLGKALFFDKGLSANGQVACATCHDPEKHFTDGKRVAEAMGAGTRNTPTVLNSRYGSWFFWDGRADSLAAQALGPLENPLEHGSHRLHAVVLVWQRYQESYEALFGPVPGDLRQWLTQESAGLATVAAAHKPAEQPDQPPVQRLLAGLQAKSLVRQDIPKKTPNLLRLSRQRQHQWEQRYQKLSAAVRQAVDQMFARIGLAIAGYERSLVNQPSAFDRFLSSWQGDGPAEEHFTEDFDQHAYAGLKLFLGKAQCALCHHGPMLTDGQFHHAGFPQTTRDEGRAAGLTALKTADFGCESQVFTEVDWVAKSQACQEKPFLASETTHLVGAFKTPSLRNLPATAPFGHAGQFATLDEVLKHYNEIDNDSQVGHLEPLLRPLDLTPAQLQQLKAFLVSLSSPWQDLLDSSATKPQTESLEKIQSAIRR